MPKTPVVPPVSFQDPDHALVTEVLRRLPVRPRRRLPDRIEDNWPPVPQVSVLQSVAFTMIGMVCAWVLWSGVALLFPHIRSAGRSLAVPHVAQTLPVPPIASPVVRARHASQQVPRDLAVKSPGLPIETAAILQERPGPERLRIQFMDPRLLEIQWDPMGLDYEYRMYAASGPDFKDAAPLLKRALRATHMAWRVGEGVREVWFAVKAIDAAGRETDYSAPVGVRLPL